MCSPTLEDLLASVASVKLDPGVVGFVISMVRIGAESAKYSVWVCRVGGTQEEITR